MKKTQDNPLFVGINKPVEVRRNILEGSREVVEVLKQYEKSVKATREKKIALVNKLKQDIKDIASMVNKLKMTLPKVDFKDEPELKAPAKKDKQKKQAKLEPKKVEKKEAPPKPSPKSEVEKLEDELADIEKKLNSIP